MEEETGSRSDVRLRLEFEEEKQMLRKSQRKLGLKRSWVSLKPWHKTISDVVVYLIDVFELDETCPNGLILSMDGFVLPPFESTSIFKDKDIISVKRKGGAPAFVKSGDKNKSSEKVAVVENQPVQTGLKLLANEEFQNEVGGYESESEDGVQEQLENTVHMDAAPQDGRGSKKRKASEKLRSSKRKKKKNKHATTKDGLAAPVVKDNACKEENGIIRDDDDSPKERNLCSNVVSSDVRRKQSKSSDSDTKEESDHSSEPSPSSKRLSQLKETEKVTADASPTPGGTKKGPSRSARRKKAKRRWLREMAKLEKTESCQVQIRKENNKPFARDNTKLTEEPRLPDRDGSDDDDTVPVVIRPGHIRFEPLEEGQAGDQNEVSAETFKWNGTTSKKKGLKWGRGTEKAASSKRTESMNFSQWTLETSSEQLTTTSKENGLKWGTEKVVSSQRTESVNVSQGILEASAEQLTTTKSEIDFNKLPPCTSFPKEGDVLAYKLIELSSTWTPEVTSFRVGQVSKVDAVARRITLKQVPEYPIVFDTKVDEDGSLIPPDTSLYADDGSLEIDFLALINPRIVKSGPANAAVTGQGEKSTLGCLNDGSDRTSNDMGKSCPSKEHKKGNGWEDGVTSRIEMAANEINGFKRNGWEGNETVCQEKAHPEANGWGGKNQALSTDGQANAWEEISQALNAKKEQLSQKDIWGKKQESGNRSWSYRAMRGSALGPTMARLRAQNQL